MWAEAFLEQARSDWQLWELIRKHKVPSCHAVHFLQMTCEKLGKAFLIEGETITPQQASTSHLVFKRFLRIASRSHALRTILNMTRAQLRAHIGSLLPLADEIEHLTPALARGGPNVEYPWESPDYRVHIPANYSFPVFPKLREPSGNNLLKLTDLVQKNFYHLFTDL